MHIVVKAVAGSHLFGLNTPSSDRDFKGVYLPDAKSILLGQIKKSISNSTGDDNSKNSSEDIDTEYYSFDKFLRMLEEGQTVALELLFTPDDMIIEKSPLWDDIVNLRERFVHKKVSAFVGYVRTQANKYGIKGSRMGSMKKMIYAMKSFTVTDINIENESIDILYPKKLGDIWDDIVALSKEDDHIEMIEIPANKNMQNKLVPHVSVCGRKFDKSIKCEYVIDVLTKIYDSYGERAKLAETNSGIDWKALSHAVRVSLQAKELLNKGKLTLPLSKEAQDIILPIKKGEKDYLTEVQPLIEQLILDVEKAEKNSKLRSKLNNENINRIIIDVYRDVILSYYSSNCDYIRIGCGEYYFDN